MSHLLHTIPMFCPEYPFSLNADTDQSDLRLSILKVYQDTYTLPLLNKSFLWALPTCAPIRQSPQEPSSVLSTLHHMFL